MKSSIKIFQEDSYLDSLDAKVVSCQKKDSLYEVILDKTIFYPHMSGGQPKDEGKINNIDVLNVFERDDEIIHVLPDAVEGTVSLWIDFKTRFDHMQQHTGQHILSYAFDKLYGGRTVGFHLSHDYTTIDLDIAVTEDMAGKVEDYANRIIYDNRRVTAATLSYEDALKLNLRKPPLELDYLRILEIQGKDMVACGGTHVKNTGEIGIIKIIKTEKYKAGTRIEFLCGKRALNDYISKHRDIDNLSNILTCGTHMLTDNINKIKNENKDLKKSISDLKNEINDYKIADLKNSCEVKDGVCFIFKELNNTDARDLRFICSGITKDRDYIAVLTCRYENTTAVCMGQSQNLKFDLKGTFDETKSILNLKGGGNNFLLQGTGDVSGKGDEFLDRVKAILA